MAVNLSTVEDYTFETERLRIRPISEEDESLYVSLYTCERIMRNIGPVKTAEQAKKSFEKVVSAMRKSIVSRQPYYLFWIIELKETHQALGIQALNWCQIPLKHIDNGTRIHTGKNEPEIGIMLNRSAQGKQIPTEARAALLNFAFNYLNVKQIYTTFDSGNIPIARLIRKLGFSQQRCFIPCERNKEYRFVTKEAFAQSPYAHIY
ncbi:GNAT family N-acetyltransferase [Thalassotalea euphylliae]|uniref:GNAT family N-acetyltransferase n=1 Tax=Thalassotalea euphylliae TaxID=1655234 RepID=UPI003630DDF2